MNEYSQKRIRVSHGCWLIITISFSSIMSAVCNASAAPLEISTYDDTSCGGGGAYQPSFSCNAYHVIKIVNKGDKAITIKKVIVNGQAPLFADFCTGKVLKLGDVCKGSSLVGEVVKVDVESSQGKSSVRF